MKKIKYSYKPNFLEIVLKSFVYFLIPLPIFTWGFTEYSSGTIKILSVLLIISILIALKRTQYIKIEKDYILITNGYRFLINKPLKINFEKIYSLNYFNAGLIHIGQSTHLEFTYYSSGLNQSLFSLSLPFIKEWQSMLAQLDSLCECKKSINNKSVKRLVAYPERDKNIWE